MTFDRERLGRTVENAALRAGATVAGAAAARASFLEMLDTAGGLPEPEPAVEEAAGPPEPSTKIAGHPDPDDRKVVVAESGPKLPQEQRIPGYRTLTDAEIGLVQETKEWGRNLGLFVDALADLPDADEHSNVVSHDGPMVDLRWLSIGREYLQIGFMAITRAITRPGGF